MDNCYSKCSKENEIEEIHRDTKEILKLLNGNGKIGLCAKVQIIWVGLVAVSVTLVGLIVNKVWANWVN
jgi:hypothetical protein